MPWSNINTLTAECPDCETSITFMKMPDLGQTVYCGLCGTKLEVAYLRPIMLDFADDDLPPEADDFDDDVYNYEEEE